MKRILTNKQKLEAYERQKKYMKSHPWYMVFKNAKKRCRNNNSKDFKDYGGRGINCLLTIEDVKFIWVRDNAKEMKNPIFDRINNDGNYTLKNCRFTTPEVSSRNRRNRVTLFIENKRQCHDCKKIKSLNDYHKNKSMCMGREYSCKKCCSIKRKKKGLI